jgi:hypothetical protein
MWEEIYRAIQSSSTILKDVIGEIIWSRKCSQRFSRFTLFPNEDILYVDDLRLFVTVDFYRIESSF